MTDDDVELPMTEPERPADDAVPHWWPAELDADYTLLGELGRGGMAVVFRARDRDLGREVAVKVVRPRFAADEEAVARLAREARTVAQLEHPNIVGVYSIRHLADRSVALVMQLIPGRTLKQAVTEDGPFDAATAEQVLRDIARALAYAHRAGVVHRDVKPENIFLDATSGRAMLSDFGVARVMDAPTELTATGTTIGTPTYMAPEQIDGVHLDGRSDLYSLGMVGWEMLTGERPWAGESLYSVIYRQKHDQLPAIDSFREDIPSRTQYLIEGLMPKNPDRRWASAARFLTLLASDQALPGFKEWESAQRRRRRTRVFQQARQRGDSMIEAALETVKFSRPPTPVAPLDAARKTASTPPAEDSERFFEPTGAAAATLGLRSGSRTPATRQAAAAALGAAAGGLAPTQSGGFSVQRPPHLANVRLSDGVVVVPDRGRSRLMRVGVAAVALATLSAVLWIQFGPARAEEVKLIGFPDVQADEKGVAVPVIPAADTSSKGGTDSVVATGPDSSTGKQPPPGPVTTPPNARITGVSPKADSARIAAAPPPTTIRTAPAPDTTTRPAVFTSPPVVPVAPIVPTLTFPKDAGRVAAGRGHSCAIDGDGRAICWGSNDNGQLGDGAAVSERLTPGPVAGDFTFEQISSGMGHTCGLTSNDRVVCWGQNTSGQLGDGTTQSRSAPVGVTSSADFRVIRAGREHTCGISSAGNVFCWGANGDGQLGNGSRNSRTSPVLVDVPGPARVAELSLGWYHTCALTTDGAAYCWGRNDNGQLGDGSSASHSVPTKVKADVPFVSIATGASHSCAIASGTGEAWCWGRNNSGQLGNGSSLDSSVPRASSGATPFSTITAGWSFTCARGRDSGAWCWGANNAGQLGDGTVASKSVPVQVKGLGRLASLSGGGAHTCAVTAANETFCWGHNIDGQIGRGDRDQTPTPVRVGPPR